MELLWANLLVPREFPEMELSQADCLLFVFSIGLNKPCYPQICYFMNAWLLVNYNNNLFQHYKVRFDDSMQGKDGILSIHDNLKQKTKEVSRNGATLGKSLGT